MPTAAHPLLQVLHIHCRHGDGNFSKFDFFQHHYDAVDLSSLDVSIVKDYAMLLAVSTWRAISGSPGPAPAGAAERRVEL